MAKTKDRHKNKQTVLKPMLYSPPVSIETNTEDQCFRLLQFSELPWRKYLQGGSDKRNVNNKILYSCYRILHDLHVKIAQHDISVHYASRVTNQELPETTVSPIISLHLDGSCPYCELYKEFCPAFFNAPISFSGSVGKIFNRILESTYQKNSTDLDGEISTQLDKITINMAPASSESKPMYQKDEKALCFHGELLYEAKVLELRRHDAKDKNSPFEYRVHYKGWKNTWDDWVPQDRLRKLTDDNRELAANLRRELTQQTAPKSSTKVLSTTKGRKGQGSDFGSGRGSEERHSSVPAGGRGTKRGRDNDIEKVGGPFNSLMCDIPLNSMEIDNLDTSRITTNQDKSTDLPGGLSSSMDDEPDHGRISAALLLACERAATEISDSESDSTLSILSRSPTAPLFPETEAENSSKNCMKNVAISESWNTGDTEIDNPFGLRRSTKARAALPAATSVLAPALNALMSKGKNKPDKKDLLTLNDLLAAAQFKSDEEVQELLDRTPPPNDPEYISNATAKATPQIFWAPLVGGTTMQEKSLIERELAAAGKARISEPYHPYYVKTKLEDPSNLNKLHLYEGVNPKRRIAVSGVAKDPFVIDPPGSRTPFDALMFPDRLVAHLNRDDAETLRGWDAEALKKIPNQLMLRLEPEILAKMPNAVLIHQSRDVLEKLPSQAPFFQSFMVSDKNKSNGQPVIFKIKKATKTEKTSQLDSVVKPNGQDTDSSNTFTQNPEGHETRHIQIHPASIPQPSSDPGKCDSCKTMGIQCNRQKPICHWCKRESLDCSFDPEDKTSKTYVWTAKGPQHATRFVESHIIHRDIKKPRNRLGRYGGPAGSLTPMPSITSNEGNEHSSLLETSIRQLDLRQSKMPIFTFGLGNHSEFSPGTKPPVSPKEPVQNITADRPEIPRNTNCQRTNRFLDAAHAFPFDEIREPKNPLEVIQAYGNISSQEENFSNRPSIRIMIPDHLKNLLVDDWENVTKSLLLVPLPSQAPANFILDSYWNEEKVNRRLGSAEADVLEEFVAGMKVYFERSVGKILLYRFERAQLADVRKLWESGKYSDWVGRGPGDCYGAEHLTRMIVNMPEMIAQTNMDVQSVARLKEEISKFCTWLARNSSKFFCAKYEKPSAEYIENAR